MYARNVLVVEDDPDIQELLKVNLEREHWNVHLAQSGEMALLKVTDCCPNLILLDLMLPGISGLVLCQQLKNYPKTRKVPIIIVSAMSSPEDVVKGLDQGADDYVTKPFDLNVLRSRINAVIRRQSGVMENHLQEVISIHELTIDPVRHVVKAGDKSVVLTPNEFGVLQLLAADPGRVFTRQQIIEASHDPDCEVTERSVDVQIVGLRKHLGGAGRYIETIRGIGYRFKESND